MARLASAGIMLGIIAYAVLLNRYEHDFYLFSVQEDEYLEWATVWAFLFATALFAVASVERYRTEKRNPWFLVCLSAFCFVFAMEEISWGQRILGFRPPTYFLDQNFQQELNYHNIIEKDFRKLLLKVLILAYGFLLPILALEQATKRWVDKLAFVAPPTILIIPFSVTAAFYHIYPLQFTGEVTELAFGFGLMFSALLYISETNSTFWQWWSGKLEMLGNPFATVGLLTVVIFVIGIGNATVARHNFSSDPHVLETARMETHAIATDMAALYRANKQGVVTRCKDHRRMNGLATRLRTDYLYTSEFASLVQKGMSEERAQYFIDPWNSPYWIRHECLSTDGVERVLIYSFGPNRKRDSSPGKLSGDDIGTLIQYTPNKDD